MLISDNKFNNAIDEKPPVKIKPEQNDETVIKRDITINIKEEIKISGNNKSGNIPALPVFNFSGPEKVAEAKNAVSEILLVSQSDRGQLVSKVGSFNKAIEGMGADGLLEVARGIGQLMADTDGSDDILGSLQEIVFDRLKNNLNQFPSSYPIPFPIPQQPQFAAGQAASELTENTLKAPEIDAEETGGQDTMEIAPEELEWALKLQEKVSSGHIPDEKEVNKYNDIYKRYNNTEAKK